MERSQFSVTVRKSYSFSGMTGGGEDIRIRTSSLFTFRPTLELNRT